MSTAAPPVELDEETLPDEDDDTLPDELDDPPLDVDEITIEPLDPLLPPPKNPPPKPPLPPKKPPLPPTTTGTPPPPPPMKPSPAGPGGSGGALATVTTAGGQLVVVVVTMRRPGRRTWATWRVTTRCATRCLTIVRGRSATWTAPPPINAPPQAQAHSFAKAILTDITTLPRWRRDGSPALTSSNWVTACSHSEKQSIKRKSINHELARSGSNPRPRVTRH